jgi:hypothetical protein
LTGGDATENSIQSIPERSGPYCFEVRSGKIPVDGFNSGRLRLDPTPKSEDSTIEKYYTRVSGQLGDDRRKLQIMMPLGNQWEASAVQYWRYSTITFSTNILALGPDVRDNCSREGLRTTLSLNKYWQSSQGKTNT